MLVNLALASLAVADTLWAPYRPNLYFGMRAAVPESLLTGLMWFRSNDLRGVSNVRHTVGNQDDVQFSWQAYDVHLGGRQVLHDVSNRVNITTDLVKTPDGKGWEVRVRGEQDSDNVLTLVNYAGLESVKPPAKGRSDEFKLSTATKRLLTPEGIDGDVVLAGTSSDLGKFKLHITRGTGMRPAHSHEHAQHKPASNFHYSNLYVPAGEQWRANQIYLTLLQDEVGKFLAKYGENEPDIPVWAALTPNNDDSLRGNLHFAQQSFEGPFEFFVKYVPKEHEYIEEEESFDKRLEAVLNEQERRFNASLALQKPYDSSPEHHKFAREMLSSVAAGIGYFYGDSLLVAREGDVATEVSAGVVRVPPHGLLSGTPSRAFFPRGFYWDEGFNALVLMPYDELLVLDILRSWFDTMDEDGYIQREQILGGEGRSLVPEEFQVQDRSIANPPTLVMALAHLASNANNRESNEALKELYPKLVTHFDWFRRTQQGETIEFDRDYPSNEVYRWRGRTPSHILASGLDDYPRASDPNDGELHVDLVSWIGAMARSLSQIAERLHYTADAKKFKDVLAGVQKNLHSVFWNSELGQYCDITVDEYEEDGQICHLGYVSLLPFALRLVPDTDTEVLRATLDHISNSEELWSVAGVRSLSAADEFFGTGENYWRGAVWNNMNYLTLDALLHYAESSEVDGSVRTVAAKVYTDLRQNVVDNIFENYKKTGYVWESYQALSGEAKGAKAFSGWAALVANIMAMPAHPNMGLPEQPVETKVVDEPEVHDEL